MRATLQQLPMMALAGFALQGEPATAQEKFKKLSGAEIQAKFRGMQFTDEVHWAEIYAPGGGLSVVEMGAKRTGTWRIQKDQLCTKYEKNGDESCMEVWIAGRKIEMRIPGSTESSLEGVLERPISRR